MLAIGLACACPAQTADSEGWAAVRARFAVMACERLQSSEPAAAAWGGFLVAEYRLEECVPEVRDCLAAAVAAPGELHRSVAAACFDALLRCKAEVPRDLLEQAQVSTTMKLAYWRRDPAAHRAALLEVFGEGSWLSSEDSALLEELMAGALLAGLRDPEFLRRLLQAPITMELSVVGPGDAAEYEALAAILPQGLGYGCTRGHAPLGFPPTARYRVEQGGKSYVGFRITRNLASSWSECHELCVGPLPGAADTWLELMTGAPMGKVTDARSYAIEFRDPVSFLTEVTARQRATELRWRAHMEQCVKAHLLPAEHGLTPRVQLRLFDLRPDRSVPLPEIAGKVLVPGER